MFFLVSSLLFIPSLLRFLIFLTTLFSFPKTLSRSLSRSLSLSLSLSLFLSRSHSFTLSLFFYGQDEEEAEAAFNQKHALQKAKEVGPMSSLMSSE